MTRNASYPSDPASAPTPRGLPIAFRRCRSRCCGGKSNEFGLLAPASLANERGARPSRSHPSASRRRNPTAIFIHPLVCPCRTAPAFFCIFGIFWLTARWPIDIFARIIGNLHQTLEELDD